MAATCKQRFLRKLRILGWIGAFAPLISCGGVHGPKPQLAAVYVDTVALDRSHSPPAPVVLLKESEGDRELPIWIGMGQAQSIALALEEKELPRPNTHDLIKNILDSIEGNIERVVITELRGSTYYAILQVTVDAREVDVDSRPSDAIAVAIRTGAPLFASEAVLENASDPHRAPAIDAQWRPDVDEWPKHRSGPELSH